MSQTKIRNDRQCPLEFYSHLSDGLQRSTKILGWAKTNPGCIWEALKALFNVFSELPTNLQQSPLTTCYQQVKKRSNNLLPSGSDESNSEALVRISDSETFPVERHSKKTLFSAYHSTPIFSEDSFKEFLWQRLFSRDGNGSFR